jgi:phenylalanyl-tRNA synthetase beta chain
MIGLAREASAFSGVPLKIPPTPELKTAGKSVPVVIAPEAEKLAPRYMAIKLTVSEVKSPEWLKRHLLAAGIRPFNLIVDLTNYVMVEQGQP